MAITEAQEELIIIQEEQHQALLAALNKVANALPKEQKGDDKATVQAIESLGRKIENFATKITSYEKNEQSVVKVELNEAESVTLLTQMSKEIITGLEDLKAIMQPMVAPKIWEFQIKRNSFSQFIESVKAIQK